MKVKQLIKELRSMPQHLDVDVAMNDNAEYESAGNIIGIMHFIKDNYKDDNMDNESLRVYKNMPDECVIIRC